MMVKVSKIYVVMLTMLLFAVSGCKTGKHNGTQASKFPGLSVPSAITDPQARLSYIAEHFWDPYFSQGAVCDTSLLNQEIADYLSVLDMIPVAEAQRCVASFFRKTESVENDLIWNFLVRETSRYLDDPNSPYRSEDLYLPYAEGLALSDRTAEEVRESYRLDVERCSLNRFGEVAADFVYRTPDGRSHRLRDIQARFTMMIFTNPGCSACKEIASSLKNYPYVDDMLDRGRLAILSVFVDEDLDAWRAAQEEYPDKWISGYDPSLVIRDGGIYSLRAIPSIYLLDKDKKVILKDAPLEKAVRALLNEKK